MGINARPSTCLEVLATGLWLILLRLTGGGDGDCGCVSRIALVDSLLRAIFLSEGGGG